MALNIKPFYPRTHPVIETGPVDKFQLLHANQVEDSTVSVDVGKSDGEFSSQQKAYIKNLSKEYYKKLLNILD